MTLKQVFTRVRDHLLAQNAQSVRAADHTACAYRGLNGLSCAVGCLIDDAHYQSEFEGMAIGWGIKESDHDSDIRRRHARLMAALKKSGVPVDDRMCINLLGELQGVHDEVDPADWPAHLNEVGVKYLSA